MSEATLEWRFVGPNARWCGLVEALLPAAGQALDLGSDFSLITIYVDDSPVEEPCWFLLGGPLSGNNDRRTLEIFGSLRSFGRLQASRHTVIPARQIWDARDGAWAGEEFDVQEFSQARAEFFLYHNLLMAKDLARGEFTVGSIPRGQVQAFEAAWEVVVDGKLARAGLPGYSLADRRGLFSGLFSSAGVLMPDHWQIFQSLWDGGLPSGRDVLAVIRQLPQL